jgi:hypothetical protein
MVIARGRHRLAVSWRWVLFCLWIVLASRVALAGYTEDPSGIWAVPTYQSISVYWNVASGGTASVQYRSAGGEWLDAHNLFYDNSSGSAMTGQYRGSIVNLAPHTTYEIHVKRASDAAWRAFPTTVTTWQETSDPTFPVKETVVLPASLAHFETTRGGDATGYVVFDGGPNGTVIDGSNSDQDCLLVKHSRVVIRNVTMIRCGYDGVCVAADQSVSCRTGGRGQPLQDIIIERNDISRFGGPEFQSSFVSACPNLVGKIGYVGDAGVNIRDANARKVVVQRNRIHDPSYRSLRWHECDSFRSGHPNGERAIRMQKDDAGNWQGNHVFRFNEIYASTSKPYEDCIGGGVNDSYAGVPGADSDIYGNIIRYCADDAIEADGGGMNVRFWDNYIDATRTAFSFSPLSLGPVYLFRNVIDRGGYGTIDNQISSNIVKTQSAGSRGFNGPLYVYHNTSLNPGNNGFSSVFHAAKLTLNRIESLDNVWVTQSVYTRDSATSPDHDFVSCVFDYDLHNRNSVGDSGSPGPHAIHADVTWDSGSGSTSPAGGSPNGLYQVAPGPSSGYNAGVYIANFNRGVAGVNGLGDVDGAPDMGAQEYGAAPMRFGTEASWRYTPYR